MLAIARVSGFSYINIMLSTDNVPSTPYCEAAMLCRRRHILLAPYKLLTFFNLQAPYNLMVDNKRAAKTGNLQEPAANR